MITDHRVGVAEYLMSLSRRNRLLVSSIFVAAFACYAPLTLIALAGIWRNHLFSVVNLEVIGLLWVISMIGFRLRAFWWANMIPAVALSGFIFNGMATSRPVEDWPLWWEMYFFILGAAALNAYGMALSSRRLSLYQE